MTKYTLIIKEGYNKPQTILEFENIRDLLTAKILIEKANLMSEISKKTNYKGIKLSNSYNEKINHFIRNVQNDLNIENNKDYENAWYLKQSFLFKLFHELIAEHNQIINNYKSSIHLIN